MRLLDVAPAIVCLNNLKKLAQRNLTCEKTKAYESKVGIVVVNKVKKYQYNELFCSLF